MACVTLPLAALKKALAATSPTPVQATWRSEEHTSELQSQSISYAVSLDRKSTRLNSSHSQISYAVFCLKKKKKKIKTHLDIIRRFFFTRTSQVTSSVRLMNTHTSCNSKE